jgi:hypothetical protein
MLDCNRTLAKGKGIDEEFCGRREVERQYGINIFLEHLSFHLKVSTISS